MKFIIQNTIYFSKLCDALTNEPMHGVVLIGVMLYQKKNENKIFIDKNVIGVIKKYFDPNNWIVVFPKKKINGKRAIIKAESL